MRLTQICHPASKGTPFIADLSISSRLSGGVALPGGSLRKDAAETALCWMPAVPILSLKQTIEIAHELAGPQLCDARCSLPDGDERFEIQHCLVRLRIFTFRSLWSALATQAPGLPTGADARPGDLTPVAIFFPLAAGSAATESATTEPRNHHPAANRGRLRARDRTADAGHRGPTSMAIVRANCRCSSFGHSDRRSRTRRR